MKRLFLIAMMGMVAPAFADTPSPAPTQPSAPVSKSAKTDFTKPFVDDRLVAQRLPAEPDHPTVELKAGPGAR
ncbi:MAG TPA: hypothetical protein VFI23_00810 [Rhizomicrobium sp.]|nr:hypothetical protein [Rhizomicrobium sp.]